MAKKKRKKGLNLITLDIALLISFPIFAVFTSLLFHTGFFISNLLFLGLPSLYLSLRTKKAIIRSVLFTIPFGIIGGIATDKLVMINHVWSVPTIFPFQFFGDIPLEDLLWAFLIVYLIVIFYEHFLDKGMHKNVGVRLKYLFYIFSTIAIFILSVSVYNTNLLRIPYMYFIFGLLFLIVPTLTFLLSFPKFLTKFLRTVPYFFYLAILEEITGLQLGQWSFPNVSFIGWVNLFGQRFPYEELIYFMILFSTSVLCYFEFFDDNKLKLASSRFE